MADVCRSALGAPALLLLAVAARAAGTKGQEVVVTPDNLHSVAPMLAVVVLGSLLLVVLEAAVIKVMLKLPFRMVLGYTFLANLVVALVTGHIDDAPQAAWSIATLKVGHAHAVGLVTSYIVTWAVQGAILVWALSKHCDARRILKAAAIGTALSYVIGCLAFDLPLSAYLAITMASH